MTRSRRLIGLVALLALAGAAGAQGRPAEQELFGAPAEAAKPAPQVREDPLKIGGQLYLRSLAQWQEDVAPAAWLFSAPALVDGYFDARPNDRVRGYLRARLQDDLARAGAEKLLLDQVWIRFDAGRRLFFTAGKQHVKWGTGHVWNPTDFLHPSRRDPLALFDARTGLTMLKVHLPWERRGWNGYAIGYLDDSQPSGRLAGIGGAARVEAALGTAEIGIDGLVQRERESRLGVDVSAGIWAFDVYGEAALRRGTDAPLWRVRPPSAAPPAPALRDIYETYEPGFAPQVVAGLSWTWKYDDEDSLTLGGEYFHNGAGYEDRALYPAALAGAALEPRGEFTPFYLGARYAAVYLRLPKPGSWNDTTLALTTIGNLSDESYLTRLDYTVSLLTYLTLEAYAAGHYGVRGGEFRFAADIPRYADATGRTFGPAHIPVPVLDGGLALRMNW